MNKKIALALALIFTSASTFGKDFIARFWSQHGIEERKLITINYNSENRNLCFINDLSNQGTTGAINLIHPPEYNPFEGLVNVGYWFSIFEYAEKARAGVLAHDFVFVVPDNDPLMNGKGLSRLRFQLDSSTASESRKYHRVVFTSDNGALIAVFLERVSGGEYRVAALLFNPAHGERYSYIIHGLDKKEFKKDFGGGGAGGSTSACGGDCLSVHYFHTDHKGLLKSEPVDYFTDVKKEPTVSSGLLGFFLGVYLYPQISIKH